MPQQTDLYRIYASLASKLSLTNLPTFHDCASYPRDPSVPCVPSPTPSLSTRARFNGARLMLAALDQETIRAAV